MADMDMYTGIYTSRIGVAETIGVVGAAVGLVDVLRRIIGFLISAKDSDRKNVVSLLADQLDSIIRGYNILNRPTPPAYVEEFLNQLKATAQKLLKSVSSGALHRLKDDMIHGKFETRIGKLRTGITDIGNTLLPPASCLSPYQANPAPALHTSPALALQHLASAPASPAIPAPGQTFMQVNVINYQPCPIHFSMDPAQAPGVMKLDQTAFPAPPFGYPPVSPVSYPTIYDYPPM